VFFKGLIAIFEVLADATFGVDIVADVDDELDVALVDDAVDAVSDVYSVGADSIQPPPDVMGSIDHMFVTGLARLEDKLVIILDIERLVTSSILGDSKAA